MWLVPEGSIVIYTAFGDLTFSENGTWDVADQVIRRQ